MRIAILIVLIFIFFLTNPLRLFSIWIFTSPVISNYIEWPFFNPFFGSKEFASHVTGAQGFALREMFTFDRLVLFPIFFLFFSKNGLRGRATGKTDTLLLALILWFLVSAIFSLNPIHSIKVILDSFILCYVAFYIGYNFMDDKNAFDIITGSIVLLGVSLIAISLYEYIFIATSPGYRLTGPFRFWENLGLTLSFCFFVILFKIFSPNSLRFTKSMILWGLLLLCSFCIFLTQTRTIMLATIIGCTAFFYYGRYLIPKRVTWSIITIFSIFTLLVSLNPMIVKNTSFYKTRLTKKETFEGRMETYTAALRMIKSNPVTGIGLKNFVSSMEDYIGYNEIKYSRFGKTTLHNSYLVIASEAGLPALILFGAMIYHIFRGLLYRVKLTHDRVTSFWYLTMLGISISYFLSGLTFDIFFEPTIDNKIYYLCLGLTTGRIFATTT